MQPLAHSTRARPQPGSRSPTNTIDPKETAEVNPNTVGAAIALLLVAVLDAWVYVDARARQGSQLEVTVTIGSIRIDRPEVWTAGCLALFVVFFPLYLIARREAA